MERLVIPDTQEKLRRIVGMGVVIVNSETGDLWTVREKLDKEKTDRKSGQLSIPLETRKIGESPRGNLQGAMAEAFDDEEDLTRPSVLEGLYHVGTIPQRRIVVGTDKNTILCDVALLLHDGRPITKKPFSDEVEDSQWMNPDQFLEEDARSLARIVVQDVMQSGIYRENLLRYHSGSPLLQQTFQNRFSIRDYATRREAFPDYGSV